MEVRRLTVEMAPLRARPRVAVVGVSGVASYAHLPAYERIGADVVAVADSSAEALCEAGRSWPGGIRRFVGVRELAGATGSLGLDLIDICTPSPTHFAVAMELIDCLGSECPALIVQKPLAQSRRDAEELVRQAQRRGIRVGVNLNARYVPTFRAAQRAVRSGEIGNVLCGSVVNQGWNRKLPGEWRSVMEHLIVGEMATHHLDLLVWMLGPVASVSGAVARAEALNTQGENIAHILLAFEGGSFASVVEDWAMKDGGGELFHPLGERMTLTGTKGSITATPQVLSVTRDNESYRGECHEPWFPGAFAGALSGFIASVQAGTRSELDATDHLHLLEVVDAVYEAADRRETVRLVSAL